MCPLKVYQCRVIHIVLYKQCPLTTGYLDEVSTCQVEENEVESEEEDIEQQMAVSGVMLNTAYDLVNIHWLLI